MRITSPIKRAKGEVSPEIVEDFFARYEVTAAGIPPENVFNYDESNLTNNPGKSKALFKQGKKYCERVQDYTKSSISG